MKRRLYIILLVTSVVLFSCKDYLTVEPEGYIPYEQTFKTADDAITAVFGLYGLMQPCVDQLFLAGDVQSDLVVAARGADPYIAEIAQNRITPRNPYTDYTNFYKLVCACNNAIKGLGEIMNLDPFNYTVGMYNSNIGEIVCIRAWAYLQLVKIWGDVPYVENTVTNLDEITDIAPTGGDVILTKIEKEVTDLSYPQLNLFSNLPRNQFMRFSILLLMNEINLYLNNMVRADQIIRPYVPLFGNTSFANFQCGYSQEKNWILQFAYTTGTWANVQTSVAYVIQFDGSRGQKNNLMRWTSPVNGGIYAVKPSSCAINNWATQPFLGQTVTYDQNNVPIVVGSGDFRGYQASYFVIGKDTVISKYLLKAYGVLKDPSKSDYESNDDATFTVYRDGIFYLACCEAYNTMGLNQTALKLLNGEWGYSYLPGGVRIRGRVGFKSFSTDPAAGDRYHQMEKMILDERGLEGAYEGQRWFDLVRFARRNNDPAMLADRVSKKYPPDQQAAMKAKLSNPNYWYWPYYYKNLAANKLLTQKPGYN